MKTAPESGRARRRVRHCDRSHSPIAIITSGHLNVIVSRWFGEALGGAVYEATRTGAEQWDRDFRSTAA
jgi:hypothetical protein